MAQNDLFIAISQYREKKCLVCNGPKIALNILFQKYVGQMEKGLFHGFGVYSYEPDSVYDRYDS